MLPAKLGPRILSSHHKTMIVIKVALKLGFTTMQRCKNVLKNTDLGSKYNLIFLASGALYEDSLNQLSATSSSQLSQFLLPDTKEALYKDLYEAPLTKAVRYNNWSKGKRLLSPLFIFGPLLYTLFKDNLLCQFYFPGLFSLLHIHT